MENLVKKAQHGDTEAFSQLILLLKKDLYRIAKTRMSNDDDIYDAIQETMIIAFNSIKKLKKTESFKPWIIKILINVTNTFYRKAEKNHTISLDKVEYYSAAINSDYDNIDIKLDFNFILDNFDYEDRLILALFYMEKFTDKEIGKILNLKENTVKTKRTRIKEKIRKILNKGGQEIYG